MNQTSHPPLSQVHTLSRAWDREIRQIRRPRAEIRRIPSDTHPLGNAGCARAVERKHLVPSGRADVRVRRRLHGAAVARAGEGREERALAHGVAVRGAADAHDGDARDGAGRRVREGVRAAVSPVRVGGCHGDGRAHGVAHEVGGHEDLDAVFLGVARVLGVGAGDEDAAIVEEDGLRVVHACNGGVGHDGEAVVDGLGGVIEDGVQVGVGGETEAGDTLVGAVDDEVGAVWQGCHAGHDAPRGLHWSAGVGWMDGRGKH